MIEAIYICGTDGSHQASVDTIEAVAGKGLVGDRYFGVDKHPGQNVTFVEAEQIERFNEELGQSLPLDATRRNVVTRGVRLNDLVGKEFRVGDAVFYGVELCEPCAGLGGKLENDAISKVEIVKALTHRAGLRTDVRVGGTLTIGAAIEVVAPG